jgi:hypothetical protein
MSFGIYQISQIDGTPDERQLITKPPVVRPATTIAADLMPANPARAALAILNETDKLVYMAVGVIETEANRASATNKILEIPPRQRILLSGDDCPREALNIVWKETTTGNLEIVERERV